MKGWGTEGNRRLLTFSANVLHVFHEFRQVQAEASEAGGVLLGYVRGDHLEVVEATRPTMWDRRLRYLFERFPNELIVKARWRATDGKLRYLGEWHTHPESVPYPSSTDLIEWRKKAKERVDRRPLLAVIVGVDELHVRLVPSDGEQQTFALINE
jgi:integrative and conjugative element protein (TIGR02256 family)